MGVVLSFSAMRLGATRAEIGAAPPPPARSFARDAPLRCLAGDALAERFHKWRALSGRDYVFSVFPAKRRDAGGPLAGLPEFESAVAFGVVRSEGGLRRLPAFEIFWREGRFHGDGARAAAALRAGAAEWHVHLLARDAAGRRAVIEDFSD